MTDLRGRNFLSLLDFEVEELAGLVGRSLAFKHGDRDRELADTVLGLLFFAPSVRTRVSCAAAVARLGGQAVSMQAGTEAWSFEARDGAVMDGSTQEHVRELAPVLSRYCDWVGIRRSELATSSSATAAVTRSYADLAQDTFLHAYARFAERPVLNLESNRFHPLQGLADMATIRERIPDPRGVPYVLTWAWHPKALPAATPHSQLVAAASLGMEVRLLRPEGWGLEPEVVARARARAEAAGGSLVETDDREAALRGARVVCAKSWGALDAYGRFEEEARAKEALRGRWLVSEDDMARTAEAFFLHCLPVRRNVVVADGVLDGPRAAHVDEAENRMWTTMAVLAATRSA